MRAAEHPAALSSQSSAAFLQAYTQYPHRDFCLLFPPGLQPHEALTDTPRLLPTASVTKETSQHDTATHKRATGGGGRGGMKITVFPTRHRGCTASPLHPPHPGGLSPLPPGPWAGGAKWDMLGLEECWKLDITP